ncbi:MAG TPA: caspase family protein [Cyclobacteriaceae bacterium]|nr:caspase family protein [Cyclobacteriaceae bacterium]MCB9237668.1 caspase family protein [Flammeovirgaceae bacterium]MCO5270230.1 caspase family protein [Cyclobacteriaceae bacterium]MCW5902206.1 caspase family protein [Cyclobacteriaceae bacterium]HOO09202.1 caspase family protein [Cyclobacteriaceae bacterium]
MKPSVYIAILFVLGTSPVLNAQNVSSRTNEFEVDFSDPNKLVSSVIPVISWITPVAESNYSNENKYKIKFEIESDKPIKNIQIIIKESEESASRGMLNVQPEEGQRHNAVIEKNVTLMDGNNVIEVVAENEDGTKTVSQRTVRIGTTALADAAKLDRTDYAILFATNDYDNWPDLVNPVNDTRMIAKELRENFGFKVEVVEGGSQAEILTKLREYAEKKYKPLDQLFVFFAGHGQYDETFGEGFVVTKESMTNDVAKTTYLSHNRLRSIINNIPCEHIFLAMDVCFGGTFDQAIAHRGLDEDIYKEATQAEMVTRKLTYKTRKYLTSGGKEYVPDGRPGMNSPFARKILEALRGRGGKDLILSLGELNTYVEALKPQPRMGEFGDNAPGSDFVFIAR